MSLERHEGGPEQIFRTLGDDGLRWIALGVITKVETHRSWGWLLTIEERPSGREVQARPWFPGAGAARGIFPVLATGAEVLLVYPGGRTSSAIALVGLTTGANAAPSSADNEHLAVVEPGGVQVRLTAEGTVEPVLLAETFQGDLSGFLTAFTTFLTTCSTATFAAQIAAAAVTLLNDPRVSALVATSLTARTAQEFYSSDALEAE